MKSGTVVKGHFCYDCLKTVDDADASKDNPYRTDFCLKCGHRKEGLISTGQVGDWGMIGKNT